MLEHLVFLFLYTLSMTFGVTVGVGISYVVYRGLKHVAFSIKWCREKHEQERWKKALEDDEEEE